MNPRVHHMRVGLEDLREALRADSTDYRHRKKIEELLEDPSLKTIYLEMEDKFKGTPIWEKLEDWISTQDGVSWPRCGIDCAFWTRKNLHMSRKRSVPSLGSLSLLLGGSWEWGAGWPGGVQRHHDLCSQQGVELEIRRARRTRRQEVWRITDQ